MKKSKKIVIAVVGAIVLLLAAGLIGGSFYLYNYALNPVSREDMFTSGKSEVGKDETSGEVTEQEKNRLKLESEDVFLTSFDGLNLHGYYWENKEQKTSGEATQEHRYAVLVHGYKGDAASMAAFAQNFHELGFSILAPDLRGHGSSEGDYIGMGWHDRLDVIDWIETLIAKDPDAEIILFGISMGGATVMMVSGEELPPNVKLIIEDCGYTSVWDEFKEQLRQMFHLPAFPLMNIASFIAQIKAGYGFQEASAVEQVKKAVVPMLFIHGDADTFVPYWMLDVVYEAAACEKQKLVVPGAEHARAADKDPKLYWSTIREFISKYMD